MRKILFGLLMAALLAAAPDIRHLQLTTANGESEFPSLAWTGSQLGVAWMDGRDGNQEIYFRAADMNAQGSGPESRITNSETWDDRPSLCWTGADFAAAWIHENKSTFNLYFQKLDPTGRPRGKQTAIVREAMLGKDAILAWSGAGYGLVSTEYREGPAQGSLVFRFLDDAGKVAGSPETVVGAGNNIPGAMLRAGSDFIVFYQDDNQHAVYSVVLDPFGKPRNPPQLLSTPGAICGLPAAAFNGKVFVAAWPRETGTAKDIMAVIMSPDGKKIGTPYLVTTPDQDRPAVAAAAGPNGFGLAWIGISEEGRSLYFRALDPMGKPLEEPVRLSKPRPAKVFSNRMSMEADNAGYVIAWVDLAPPFNTEIILTRVGF
ncbi:MAG TPA: hypothetical protein VM658_03505 [bacterium]|nr:hypothetical protein [bacterium]